MDHPNSQTVSFRITAIIDHLVGMGWPIALDPTLPDEPAYMLVSGPSKLRIPALASDLVTGGKINVQRKIDDSRHMTLTFPSSTDPNTENRTFLQNAAKVAKSPLHRMLREARTAAMRK